MEWRVASDGQPGGELLLMDSQGPLGQGNRNEARCPPFLRTSVRLPKPRRRQSRLRSKKRAVSSSPRQVDGGMPFEREQPSCLIRALGYVEYDEDTRSVVNTGHGRR